MEKKEICMGSSGKEGEQTMDVYSIIRSAEIRDYYRKIDACDSLEKKMVLIQHSYISVQKKAAMLKQLSGTGTKEENRLLEEVCRMYDRYIGMIFHPTVRSVFLLQSYDQWLGDGWMDNNLGYLDDAYESLDEVTARMEEVYSGDFAGEKTRAGAHVEALQVPRDGKAEIAFEFEMFWIDGNWEIQRFIADDEKLASQGFSEDAIEFVSYIGGWQYHPLPFENGCRLKLQVPFMEEPIYGTLESELDGNGCWYHFLYSDEGEGKETGMIALTDAEIDLTSGYSSIDWIERA